jgi:hypothetical protein
MPRTSAEYDELDALLQLWGTWWEKHFEDVVLPKQSAFCMIPSDQPAGSRILCADMSRRVYQLNRVVLMMRFRYRQALFVWYAVQIKTTGGYWSIGEKATALECSENSLRLRVTRARRFIVRKFPWVLESPPNLRPPLASLRCDPLPSI